MLKGENSRLKEIVDASELKPAASPSPSHHRSKSETDAAFSHYALDEEAPSQGAGHALGSAHAFASPESAAPSVNVSADVAARASASMEALQLETREIPRQRTTPPAGQRTLQLETPGTRPILSRSRMTSGRRTYNRQYNQNKKSLKCPYCPPPYYYRQFSNIPGCSLINDGVRENVVAFNEEPTPELARYSVYKAMVLHIIEEHDINEAAVPLLYQEEVMVMRQRS